MMANRLKHRQRTWARRIDRVVEGKPADPSSRKPRDAKPEPKLCPVPDCGRPFKTLLAFKYHLLRHDRDGAIL